MASGLSLNIDTTKSEFQNPMVQLRQGDGNYQSLAVTVTSNGEPLNLTGWTVTFMGTTAGEFKIVDSAVTVTNALQGEFTYTPTKAWGQDQGEFKNAYFKFTKEYETASGASFRVNVLDAVDLTAEEAKDYISVVDVLIDDVKTSMDEKLAETKKTLADTKSQATTVQGNVNDLNNNVNDLKSQNNAIKTTDNTWTGNNTFTSPIIGRLKTYDIKDGYDLNGYQSDGTFLINGANNIVNYPANSSKWAILVVKEISNSTATQTLIDTNNDIYNRTMGGNPPTWSSWFKAAKSSEVVHNTGTETIAGDKTFTGANTFSQPINGTIKGIATPYQYGAVGDGVADDTNAIQSMLNDWKNELCVLKGDFKITKSLLVNKGTRIVFSGKIILSSAVDYLFKSTANFGIDGGGTGQIILNYNGGAFTVGGNSVFTPQGVRIFGVNDNTIAINVEKNLTSGDTNGYVHLNDVTIVNDKATTGSIGIYGGRDSNYNHLETINIETGMKLYGWDNFIDGYHPWNDIQSVVNNGVGIHLESNANDTHVSNYYNDTMKYGFILDSDVTLTIDNALTMWNKDYYNDDNGSGNPFFIYWSNDQLQNVGKMITVSNSPMNQTAGTSNTMLPYFSSLPNNYISINNAGNAINWVNLPISQTVSGNNTFTGSTTFNKPINGNTARQLILDGYDLNGYIFVGDWIINGSSGLNNYPSGANNYGYLHVEWVNNNTTIQTIRTVDLTTYIRSYSGTKPVWSAWKKIVPQSL